MDRFDASRLARRLLVEHGLTDWTFGFNRRKRALGLCRYTERRVELSIYLVDLNSDEEVLDTLLHEIAHALCGPKAGHGPKWRAKCRELGAKPERLCSDAAMPRGPWRATCPGCRHEHARHRRPMRGRTYHCTHCGAERGKLEFRWVR